MSRNSDPFPLVKGEVEKSIAGVAQLYERWTELANSPQDASDEFAFLTGELKTGLKSIEWDLQDLEETISIVQRQNKFGISEAELFEREQFVRSTRERVVAIQDHLSRAQAAAGNATRYMHDSLTSGGSAKQDRFAALDAAIEDDNRQFVQAHQKMQDDMYQDQEEGLQELSVAFGTLHNMGNQMHDELSRQEKMLEETEENIDKTSTRVGRAIRRTDDLLNKSKGNWGWIIIACLVVALMVTFVLILIL